MSELRRSIALPVKSGSSPSRLADLRKRWPLYAGGAIILILALAWFDGGYEPIHPITQPVEYAPATGESN